MTEELTDDEKRVRLLRACVHVCGAMLYEAYDKPYNVILLVCPKDEAAVSLCSRVESDEALNGMATVFMNTIKEKGREVLQ
jgi:hypothetical protein